jgi:uncharacterized protein (DUF488 family)
MPPDLFTVGHSTQTLAAFLELLSEHGIRRLADIRRFPGSKKYPHFNSDTLGSALEQTGVRYRWIEALGGRRGKQTSASTENLGWRNESFRNYADYMRTADFQTGIAELLEFAGHDRTAFMCSESVFWRCHRRLVSDYLLARGIQVRHIMPSGELHPHTLTSGAVIHGGLLSYPAPGSEQGRLFE